MPRWARLLSCSVTGLVLSWVGFFVAAAAAEGGPGFWQGAADFAGTPAFWQLVRVFAVIAVMALLVARLMVRLYRMAAIAAGLIAGAVVALAYTFFVVAVQADHWGGLALSLQKIWPAAGLFLLPFAAAGAFTNWLWDRLD